MASRVDRQVDDCGLELAGVNQHRSDPRRHIDADVDHAPQRALQQRAHTLQTVIVGIDGAYLRNWHDRKRKFEVIVGKAMAEDRTDRYFGLV